MILVLKNMLKPRAVSEISKRFSIFFIFVSLTFLIIGLYVGIFISPPDYQQGDSVRIMYVHVPAATMASMVYALIALSSAVALIWKHSLAHITAKAAAPIGAVFTFIALATGALWGQPTWGTFWAWDARLTSMLVLFLFYVAYILTWKIIKVYEKANKVSSIIGIIGTFNLPIIRYSVDWWNTLHQPSSITLTSAPTIHYSMLLPLIIMFIAMLIYSFIIFLMKYKTELMKVKLDKKKNFK